MYGFTPPARRRGTAARFGERVGARIGRSWLLTLPPDGPKLS
jgi:hypothetical protein